MINPSKINVLFIASEADPFVKVGGLADVAGSLPRALKEIYRSGEITQVEIDIRLVIPYHPQIREGSYKPALVAEYTIPSKDGPVEAHLYAMEVDGLPVYLVGGDLIDQETSVYSADLEADGYKYVFFSLAALELCRQIKWKPDILHANDWHTAAAIYSMALQRSDDPFFKSTASLLTIHNLPYLGSMTAPALEAFGLPPAEHSDLPSWAQQMALPLGLLSADAIVAVSPGYAREILDEEYGSGLDGFLKAHTEKLFGILNGLDTNKWNPATDKLLAQNFSSINLTARATNKASLQERLGLELNPGVPILGMVTRMDPQKGVDLAVDALRLLIRSKNISLHPFQAVILGTGNPVLENAVRQLELDFPQRIRASFQFNEALAHTIYGGSDMLLMPSRYEPCGLSQMIAMHYGCIPIARATGGLSDTIQDPSETELSTGFLFTPTTPKALANAIQTALEVYKQDLVGWQKMQLRGMQQDFSWAKSAQEYLQRYKLLLA